MTIAASPFLSLLNLPDSVVLDDNHVEPNRPSIIQARIIWSLLGKGVHGRRMPSRRRRAHPPRENRLSTPHSWLPYSQENHGIVATRVGIARSSARGLNPVDSVLSAVKHAFSPRRAREGENYTLSREQSSSLSAKSWRLIKLDTSKNWSAERVLKDLTGLLVSFAF